MFMVLDLSLSFDLDRSFQAIECRAVEARAPALERNGTIPLESALLERRENRIRGAGLRARFVNVFHAHNPASPLRARIEIAA